MEDMSLVEAVARRKLVLSLYKTLLRLHRGLPEELRIVGTPYVRDEFRRHKEADSQLASVFISEWTNCALVLAEQLGVKGIKKKAPLGLNMEVKMLDKFSEEQIVQLHELMKAARRNEEVR